MAMARYVDDHVSVPVIIETRSRVNEAPVSSPRSRMSNVTNVTMTMKTGDSINPTVLTLLLGTSSNRTLTRMKPAVIDSTICRSQTKSSGRPPPTRISRRFKTPNPFDVPRRFESMNRSTAIIVLCIPLGRLESFSRASCSIYYTYLYHLKSKCWGSVAGRSRHTALRCQSDDSVDWVPVPGTVV